MISWDPGSWCHCASRYEPGSPTFHHQPTTPPPPQIVQGRRPHWEPTLWSPSWHQPLQHSYGCTTIRVSKTSPEQRKISDDDVWQLWSGLGTPPLIPPPDVSPMQPYPTLSSKKPPSIGSRTISWDWGYPPQTPAATTPPDQVNVIRIATCPYWGRVHVLNPKPGGES